MMDVKLSDLEVGVNGLQSIKGNPNTDILAVECFKCHTLHRKDSDSYVSFQGNLFIGEYGGVLGGKPGSNAIFCRKLDCLKEVYEQITPEFKKLTLVTTRDLKDPPAMNNSYASYKGEYYEKPLYNPEDIKHTVPRGPVSKDPLDHIYPA